MSVGRLLALGVAALCVIAGPTIIGGMKASSPVQQARRGEPQSPGNAVAFEVASVRANKSGQVAMPSRTRGRIYTATNIALRNVIAAAYGVPAARVLDGPSWIGAASVDMRFVGGDRFDISATLPEGSSADQVPVMLRALLADRFKLIIRRETREAPMYALVLARSDGRLGSQLRKALVDCEAVKPEDQARCQLEIGGEILGRGQRLSGLARALSLFADRPVVDRSGLTGGYDFNLRFPELNTPPDATGTRADPVSGIFTALQEQLGLKLDSIRGELDFIVIDSVERPTEN